MTEADLLADARKLIAAGADKEMIVLFLRDKGLNKIASIRAIRALFTNSTSEAKTLVDESKAWSDRFYSDLDLRDKARQATFRAGVLRRQSPSPHGTQ